MSHIYVLTSRRFVPDTHKVDATSRELSSLYESDALPEPLVELWIPGTREEARAFRQSVDGQGKWYHAPLAELIHRLLTFLVSHRGSANPLPEIPLPAPPTIPPRPHYVGRYTNTEIRSMVQHAFLPTRNNGLSGEFCKPT